MDRQQRFTKIMRQSGHRVTQPRQVVFDFMLDHGEPVKINQIIALSGNWADRASLYRSIKLFKQLGIASEVHRPGGDWLELGEDYAPHHHHLHCYRCGLSQTLASPALEQTLDEAAEGAGFKPISHQVEVSGLCPDCLAAGRDQ